MGLSTHVLDTMHGQPAAGMQVQLHALRDGHWQLLRSLSLNTDGRNPDGPLLGNTELQIGQYRLCFEVAGYYQQRGVILPQPPFLDVVQLDFGIADLAQHYHVPLLCTPWSYSTYRGS
jgi:5-hydroxyisourate hydrolase